MAGGSETSDHGDQFGAIAPDPTADEVKRLTLELRTATGKVRLKQQHIIEQDAQRKRTEMLLDHCRDENGRLRERCRVFAEQMSSWDVRLEGEYACVAQLQEQVQQWQHEARTATVDASTLRTENARLTLELADSKSHGDLRQRCEQLESQILLAGGERADAQENVLVEKLKRMENRLAGPLLASRLAHSTH